MMAKIRERDICENKHGGNSESEAAMQDLLPFVNDQRERVLQAVRDAGQKGITCKELATRWNVGMNQISGRFSALKKDGLIEPVFTDEGKVTRDKCAVLVAVES